MTRIVNISELHHPNRTAKLFAAAKFFTVVAPGTLLRPAAPPMHNFG
jgi:hypothetical protein